MRAIRSGRRQALLLMLLLGFLPPLGAQRVSVPGTRVTLEAPPAFSPARQYAGFEDATRSASIVVNELPAPVTLVTAGLTADGLQSRGITLVSSEQVTIAGRSGQLLQVTQNANGVLYEKWMASFGDESTTIMIVATYPQAVAASLGPELRTAILTAAWNPEVPIDLDEGLPFRIGESAHLKIQTRVQNTLVLGDPEDDGTATSPVVVVGSSIGTTHVADVEQLARQRLAQTDVVELHGVTGGPKEVAGLGGYELIGRAKDGDTEQEVSVYQVLLLADDGTYYLIQGIVPESRFAELLPELRQIAESFGLR